MHFFHRRTLPLVMLGTVIAFAGFGCSTAPTAATADAEPLRADLSYGDALGFEAFAADPGARSAVVSFTADEGLQTRYTQLPGDAPVFAWRETLDHTADFVTPSDLTAPTGLATVPTD